MSLDSLYTSVNYNSYVVTTAALTVYVDALDGFYDISSWTAATTPQKENLTLGAVNDLNMFDFIGSVNSSIVSPFNMKWPRQDTMYVNGVTIGNTEIPIFILQYLAERVIEKLANPISGKFDTGGVKRQKLGDLEQEFFSPYDKRYGKSTLKKFPSFEIIRPYTTNSANNMRYLMRA